MAIRVFDDLGKIIKSAAFFFRSFLSPLHLRTNVDKFYLHFRCFAIFVKLKFLPTLKPAIRRLTRRVVKRLSRLVYNKVRKVLKSSLESAVKDAVTYTDYARRKTATALDVVYELKIKRQGRTIYQMVFTTTKL